MAVNQQRDALAELLRASMAYQSRVGHEDPLAQLEHGGVAYGQPSKAITDTPHQVLNEGASGLERVASVTQRGPRAGMAKVTFDIGNGMRANVYYDKRGHRDVQVFRAG